MKYELAADAQNTATRILRLQGNNCKGHISSCDHFNEHKASIANFLLRRLNRLCANLHKHRQSARSL